MLEYKETESNNSVTSGRFPVYFESKSNLKKLFTLFAWHINSLRTYLFELFDSYRFYKTGTSLTKRNTNFGDEYEHTDGAMDKNLLRLAKSMNISETTFSRIFFEWQSKFLPRTTEEGISSFIKLFFKYELVDRFMDEESAQSISDQINVSVFSWYDSDISDIGNVYSYDDYNVLTLSLEVSIPSAYSKYFINLQPKLQSLMKLIYNVIVPTAKINYVEISWR